MSAPRAGDTKYTPLGRALQALPATQPGVTLPLTAIAPLLAATLPMGARTPGFWTGHGAVLRPLQQAGWHATLTPDRTTVRFHRGARATRGGARRDHAAMVAAYRAGTRVRDIAQAVGRHPTTVYAVLRQAGVVPRGRR